MNRLLGFLVGLRRLPPLSLLSGDEERLLFQLRELWEYVGVLSVSDVYDLVDEKSAATSYRRLMALKERGLVDVTIDEADRRKRAVTFTAAAEELFERLRTDVS